MAQPQSLEEYLGLLDPSRQPQLGDEAGNVYDRSGSSGGAAPGLTKPIQTFGPYSDTQGPSQDAPAASGETAPLAPPARTGPVVARHGGTQDPATGAQTVGQPTGAAPAATPPSTDYSKLNDLLSQLMMQQQTDRISQQGYRDSLHNSVLGLIKSGSAPADANDPNILAATQAFSGEGQRSLALLQEKLAEGRAATGRSAGSVEAGIKGGFENLGTATGGFKANLMIDQLKQRQAQLMSALQIGAGVMSSEEQQSLQEELGLINSRMTQLGIGNQNQQFYDKLTADMGAQTNSLDSLLASYLLSSGQAA